MTAENKRLWGVVTFLAASCVTWAAWITLEVGSKPGRPEVKLMIDVGAPYNKDRSMILAAIVDIKDAVGAVQKMHADMVEANSRRAERITEAINNNTSALIELRTMVRGGEWRYVKPTETK